MKEQKNICENCKGEGQVEKNIHRGEEGMMIEMDVMVTCGECEGTGQVTQEINPYLLSGEELERTTQFKISGR